MLVVSLLLLGGFAAMVIGSVFTFQSVLEPEFVFGDVLLPITMFVIAGTAALKVRAMLKT